MDNARIETLTAAVIQKLKEGRFIEIEASGRHVHLSRQAVDLLFGEGYRLTRQAELSQPGQFLCKEKVTLLGPRAVIANVAVLGPERPAVQVEISKTDARELGVDAVIRESGDIKGAPGIFIISPTAVIRIDEGVIVAKRHVHVTPEYALRNCLTDKEIIKVEVYGSRKVVFDDVVVRVSPDFRNYMHIDYDEANAFDFKKGGIGRIVP
ncbi:MAG: phosphate propanoyltransferase [Clostridiales bacterium]|jgi:propanediol utilization protein|nr:phosphate propanoyltransferase [Clostridiales bacterium]